MLTWIKLRNWVASAVPWRVTRVSQQKYTTSGKASASANARHTLKLSPSALSTIESAVARTMVAQQLGRKDMAESDIYLGWSGEGSGIERLLDALPDPYETPYYRILVRDNRTKKVLAKFRKKNSCDHKLKYWEMMDD